MLGAGLIGATMIGASPSGSVITFPLTVISGTTRVSGVLYIPRLLAGSIADATTATATITLPQRELFGTLAAATSLTADMHSPSRHLDADLSLATELTGALHLPSRDLAGRIHSLTAASGTVSLDLKAQLITGSTAVASLVVTGMDVHPIGRTVMSGRLTVSGPRPVRIFLFSEQPVKLSIG